MVVTTAKKLISNSCKLVFLPPHMGGQVYVYIALAKQRILGFDFVVVCIDF